MLPTSRLGDDLDPAVREFIRRTGEDFARLAAGRTLGNPEARKVAEAVREPWRAGGPLMRRTSERQVVSEHGPVRVRIHQPAEDGPRPALIYLHGGGWTYFSLDTHDRLMREYAARAGVVVIGVDYALSPEARFPVALEQALAVVRWAAEGGAGADVLSSRLAIGGDSAGANLSLAAAMALRNQGLANLLSALLLSYGPSTLRSRPSTRPATAATATC